MTSPVVVLALLLLLVSSSTCHVGNAFYIPGMSPRYYKTNENVNMTVNSLRSHSVFFPQDYYSAPFCKTAQVRKGKGNIGSTLWGDKEMESLYVAKMGVNEHCVVLPECDPVDNTKDVKANLRRLEKLIDQNYRGFINIDNLPFFTGKQSEDSDCSTVTGSNNNNYGKYEYQRGYPLGISSRCDKKNKNSTVLYNHIHFVITYNKPSAPNTDKKSEEEKFMVVGLNGSVLSRNWMNVENCKNMTDFKYLKGTGLRLYLTDIEKGATVYWTYSVEWAFDESIAWATRWDAYFRTSTADSEYSLHIVYIVASVVIILFTSSAVFALLLRALHRDFNRYNVEDVDDMQEETGWKLIHADVFRPPDRAHIISVFVGNGYQLLTMVTIVLILALLGFLSPSRRGALLSCVLLAAVFTSIASGYVCGLLLRYFNCKEWKHVFACGTAFPGAVCGLYLITNIMNAAHGATTTAPFSTILTIFVLWVFVSVPLTVLGASFAFRQEPISNPIRVGRLAREIPVQSELNSPAFLLTISPLFPLCTILLELQFVLQSIWEGQVYYVFAFLSIACVLWLIVTCLVTVFQLYYVLCYENHRWWWLAFMIPSCLGLHMFLYTLYFMATQLTVYTFASVMLYIMYMAAFSFAYGLAAGAVGFTAGFAFVRAIYGNIKVD